MTLPTSPQRTEDIESTDLSFLKNYVTQINFYLPLFYGDVQYDGFDDFMQDGNERDDLLTDDELELLYDQYTDLSDLIKPNVENTNPLKKAWTELFVQLHKLESINIVSTRLSIATQSGAIENPLVTLENRLLKPFRTAWPVGLTRKDIVDLVDMTAEFCSSIDAAIFDTLVASSEDANLKLSAFGFFGHFAESESTWLSVINSKHLTKLNLCGFMPCADAGAELKEQEQLQALLEDCCKTLKVLKIDRVRFINEESILQFPPAKDSLLKFPRLEALTLGHVKLRARKLEDSINSMPRLKSLSIDNIAIEFQSREWRPFCQTLRHKWNLLTITVGQFRVGRHWLNYGTRSGDTSSRALTDFEKSFKAYVTGRDQDGKRTSGKCSALELRHLR